MNALCLDVTGKPFSDAVVRRMTDLLDGDGVTKERPALLAFSVGAAVLKVADPACYAILMNHALRNPQTRDALAQMRSAFLLSHEADTVVSKALADLEARAIQAIREAAVLMRRRLELEAWAMRLGRLADVRALLNQERFNEVEDTLRLFEKAAKLLAELERVQPTPTDRRDLIAACEQTEWEAARGVIRRAERRCNLRRRMQELEVEHLFFLLDSDRFDDAEARLVACAAERKARTEAQQETTRRLGVVAQYRDRLALATKTGNPVQDADALIAALEAAVSLKARDFNRASHALDEALKPRASTRA